MKLTHVITTIERGGAEKAVLSLASAQVRSGHRVTVVPLKGKPELLEQFQTRGVKVCLDLLSKNPMHQIHLLKRFFLESNIVHAHLPRAELISRLAFGKGKFLITRHNAEKFFPKAPNLISSFLSKWVTHNSYLIAISNAVNEFLMDHKELHLSCRAKVVYYGYEKQKWTGSANMTSRDKVPIVVGTISRLTPQKNLKLLLLFVQHQLANNRHVLAKIVGDGPMKNELESLAVDLGISKNVEFLGKTEQVLGFLASLDFFFLTSNYEGFGLSLLEAFDANVPVVASNVSAIPEVVGKNHSGLFDCGSLESLVGVFEKLLFSVPAQTQLLAFQRERLSFFSMERYLENHESIYLDYLDHLERNSTN